MIAYNSTALRDTYIRDQASMAARKSLIEKDEYTSITKAYPEWFYTPNLFIRVGLFTLTAIITLMCLGLLFLMFDSALNSTAAAGALGIFFSLAAYATLEYVVSRIRHSRSGVDDALLWTSMLGLVVTINLLDGNIPNAAQAVLVFVLAGYSTLRFANAVMSAIGFLSFLAIIFYSIIPLGPAAKIAMPFLLMAVSFSVYVLIHRIKKDVRLRHFRRCCIVVEALSLLAVYASVNYFVVRELSNIMFHLHLKDGESIPAGWFFWMITVAFPAIYLVRAFRKKDRLLLDAGLVLMAATIFTVRYYYHFMAVEVAMAAGGALLILLAYFTTKYFSPARYDITSKAAGDAGPYINAEALVIAEAFHATPGKGAGNHIEFGGGSGGGAGAGGEY